MGLREVLADFLSSEDPQGGQPQAQNDDQEPDEVESAPEPKYDVPLDDLDQEEQVENLEHRIDSMEEDIERTTSNVETIQGSQQEVVERIEDVNGTVRQLLGIYDQLTASANPFVEGGQTAPVDTDADGFGLVDDADDVETAGEMSPADDEDDDGDEDDPDEDLADNEVVVEATNSDDEDDEGVTFEELKDGAAADDEEDTSFEAEDGGEGQQAVQERREPEEPDAANSEIEVESLAQERRRMSSVESNRPQARESVDSDATLPELADTYATDIIVFEWLTDLVTSAGPAAALRAIAYYEEIGWISPGVKLYLEHALSGPDLDLTVDPSREPDELNAEDHAESFEYIMKLDAIQETMDDTGL